MCTAKESNFLTHCMIKWGFFVNEIYDVLFALAGANNTTFLIQVKKCTSNQSTTYQKDHSNTT